MKQLLSILLIFFVNTTYCQIFISYYPPTNQNFIFDKNQIIVGYCDYDYYENKNNLYNTNNKLTYTINNNQESEQFIIRNNKNELLGYTKYNDKYESIEFYITGNVFIGHIKLDTTTAEKPFFYIFDSNGQAVSFCALIGETQLNNSRDFTSAILLSFIDLLANL